MRALYATIVKDLQLLLSDRMGLLVLFLLPMCLVLFICLTQSRVGAEHTSIKIALVNQNQTISGRVLEKSIRSQKFFNITKIKNNKTQINQTKNNLSNGLFRALIIIPNKNNQLNYALDPAISPTLGKTIELMLSQILLTQQIKQPIKINLNLITLNKQSSRSRPNIVQQNVPAWSLFGIFFIVVPLAGQLLLERESGVTERIRMAPSPLVYEKLGHIVTYIFINLLQLSFMLCIGLFILPLFGLDKLDITNKLGLIYLVGFFAALAATSFGVFIGSVTRTYQQATTIGSFIVVIAASISGIFVPSYMMPHWMTYISNISPMYWAQTAFIDVFVRAPSLAILAPNLLKLFLFFILALSISYLFNRKS